ncbi:MAG: hypothetical protein NZ870_04725 [bacterium]|nr:hypothetical protein [bacterium]
MIFVDFNENLGMLPVKLVPLTYQFFPIFFNSTSSSFNNPLRNFFAMVVLPLPDFPAKTLPLMNAHACSKILPFLNAFLE